MCHIVPTLIQQELLGMGSTLSNATTSSPTNVSEVTAITRIQSHEVKRANSQTDIPRTASLTATDIPRTASLTATNPLDQRNPLRDDEAIRIFISKNPAYPSIHYARARIYKPIGFSSALVCGGFDWDRGQYAVGVLIQSDYYTLADASKLLLPRHASWGASGSPSRLELCLKWAQEIVFAFRMVVRESIGEIKRSMPRFLPGYHQPLAEFKGDDVVVTCWVSWKEAGDKDAENTYRQARLRFNSNGLCSIPEVSSMIN